jgi:hypothetical protein
MGGRKIPSSDSADFMIQNGILHISQILRSLKMKLTKCPIRFIAYRFSDEFPSLIYARQIDYFPQPIIYSAVRLLMILITLSVQLPAEFPRLIIQTVKFFKHQPPVARAQYFKYDPKVSLMSSITAPVLSERLRPITGNGAFLK